MSALTVEQTIRYKRARVFARRLDAGETLTKDVLCREIKCHRAEAVATLALAREIAEELKCRWLNMIPARLGGADVGVGV